MAKAATADGSCVVNHPQGDTVSRSFNSDGNATGASIATVAVRDSSGTVVRNMRFQVINQPSSDGGAWLIAVTMPSTSTSDGNPYTLTVVDSDGNSGSGRFNLQSN